MTLVDARWLFFLSSSQILVFMEEDKHCGGTTSTVQVPTLLSRACQVTCTLATDQGIWHLILLKNMLFPAKILCLYQLHASLIGTLRTLDNCIDHEMKWFVMYIYTSCSWWVCHVSGMYRDAWQTHRRVGVGSMTLCCCNFICSVVPIYQFCWWLVSSID